MKTQNFAATAAALAALATSPALSFAASAASTDFNRDMLGTNANLMELLNGH